MPSYEAWSTDAATEIVASLAGQDGAALPILHALQGRFGYVDKAIVPVMAEALNLSRAEIHGTITFYHDFHDHPPGRRTVKLCRAEACQSRGAVALHRDVMERLGVTWHGTTADGAITLEPVFCLGLCANAPAALVDDEPIGNLDGAAIEALIAEARA
jgi:formate dehydrogenase subunit gamma